ncbi:tyrosine-protein kinase domain-containing protein [Alkalinema sp. FACHB-956]|uniref:GumC family protein n=1 Tax=Alkalinema sp. FACHB-956 TaxID=2692768 RepID=UPI001682D9F5|nr:tyrosine-protein kinase domain-containing protein [Alkalinema sp. FACHB-956]MBD2329745.1 polysaccharide biosynthesis tyrosine autokinase [Alkalinema sp. FACHB-956]
MESGFPPSIPPSSNPGNSQRPSWLPSIGGNQSRPNEDNDVLDIGQLLSLLKRRAVVILGVTTVVATAAAAKGKLDPTYRATLQILTRPVTAENQVVSSLPQALREEQRSPSGSARGYDDTKLRLLTSPTLVDPVVDQLKGKYPDVSYGSIVKGLQVKPVGETDIFEVHYIDSSSERVKDILDALGKRYIDYALQDRLADTKKGITFIDEQLKPLKDQVSYWQGKLQSFRQQNTFFDPESQSRELSDQMANFRRQRLENEVQLKQSMGLYQELQNEIERSPSDRTATLALRQSETYRQLLGQLLALDTRIAEQGSIYEAGSEDMQILRDNRTKLMPLLEREAERVREEVASQVRDYAERDRALRKTEDELAQRIKNLSNIAREYTDIQRELKVATDNLDQFLAKRSALDIDAGQRQTPWEIVTPIISPELASLQTNLLLGGVLGLVLGIISAVIVDRMSNVFHTPQEIKKASKLPLLGIIPFNQELAAVGESPTAASLFQPNRILLAANHPNALVTLPFLESFRLLQTNLRLLNADRPVRSISISSPTPQDGKSTTATYLAQAAASMGQRVLLVDTELRYPQLHSRFGLSNAQGLSDLVASHGDPQAFIQVSPLNDQIHVLTAGQSTTDPITLLSSPYMQEVMEQLQERYDLVIYDTPPLAGLSDAHLVAAKTDGLLLVARVGKTNRDAYEHVMETLNFLPTKVFGVVANDSRKVPSNLYTSYYLDSNNSPPNTPISTPVGSR